MVQWHLFVSSRWPLSSPGNSRVTASRDSSQRHAIGGAARNFHASSSSYVSQSIFEVSQVFSKWCSVFAGRYTGRSFSGKRASPPHGNTDDILRAQPIRRYLLSYMGSVSLSSGESAISVLHIYCRNSALISQALSLLSLLPAIVFHTSGSYVIVVELSRPLFDFLTPSTWHRFYFVERLACEKDSRAFHENSS